MPDTQTTAPASADPAAAMSMDDALAFLDANPNSMDAEGEDEAEPTDAQRQDTGARDTADEDQGESQSDTGEDDQEAEEDDQGEDQSDDESEADSDFKLFTLDKDGKQKAVDIDELEVAVEVDGEDQLLPMAELRKGYLRQQDYTRKTQEVAERVASEIDQRHSELAADFAERTRAIDDIVAVFGPSFDQEPDFARLKAQHGGDDAKAWQAYAQWKNVADKVRAARQLTAQRDQEAQVAQQRETIGRINRTVETLRETVPEWRDQAKFQAESGAMRAFMLKNGLDDNDIAAILQKPAYVLMVRDAMHGQQLRQKKVGVTKRRQKVARTVNKSGGTLSDGQGNRKAAQLRQRTRGG